MLYVKGYMAALKKSMQGLNSNSWFAASNDHRIENVLYHHFVAWTIKEDVVNVFHVNIDNNDYEEFINKTLQFLNENSFHIESIVQDRERMLLNDLCMVAITHLPAEFHRFFTEQNYIPPINPTKEHSYFGLKVDATIKNELRLSSKFEKYENASYNLQSRKTKKSIDKYINIEQMFSPDDKQLLLNGLRAFVTSEEELQLYDDFLNLPFRVMHRLINWNITDTIISEIHSTLEKMHTLEAMCMRRRAISNKKPIEMLPKTLLTLSKIFTRNIHFRKEGTMLGFQYNTALRSHATFKSNLMYELRYGLAYSAGTFENVFAKTEKRVVYVNLNLSPKILEEIDHLIH